MDEERPALTGDEFRLDEDQEFEAILARLRAELAGAPERLAGSSDPAETARAVVAARREAERLWAVTAERPYQYKPGRTGRLRGMLLLPLKAPLRRAMRWYVQPLAIDQRHFNAAVVRLIDALAADVTARHAQLERTVDEALSELRRERGS